MISTISESLIIVHSFWNKKHQLLSLFFSTSYCEAVFLADVKLLKVQFSFAIYPDEEVKFLQGFM